MAVLDSLFSLASDNPLLFGIVVFNIFAGIYLVIYIALYLYKRRHPEVMLNILLWKTSIRRSTSYSTIEELYGSVLERLRREKAISKKDGNGRLAREKSLLNAGGDKKKILQEIYHLYETKTYGKQPIEGEAVAVRRILDRLLAV